jgi:pimeloyl-ACP methyl ester carboxylesterase
MTPEVRRYRLRHRARPLDVLVAGEGRPLLLLHGWGLSGHAYREAMLAFADLGYLVAAPSLAVTDNWSIERAAESAAEAMAGVDVAPAPVVGHSFGGAIGATLALKHPDFVTGLVAVNSPLVSLGSVRMGRIMLPGAHYRIVGHGAAAGALLRSAASAGGVRALARSARWFLGAGQETLLRTLAESGLPRAVVWAANDTLLPASIGVKAAELLDCDLHLIGAENGWPGKRPPDHDWPFRQPSHFAATVHKLLVSLHANKEAK